jgi:predicted nucleic acid-binding protein
MNHPRASGAAETAADLVLDVSLSCAWCFADEASEPAWAILEQLQEGRAHVPALWLWETANVLVQAERRGRISPAAIRTYLGLLEGLPISVDQPSTASAWHDTLALARSHRLTSYDAAYLELALRRGLPLATRDKALQAAGRLEGVPLLPCC